MVFLFTAHLTVFKRRQCRHFIMSFNLKSSNCNSYCLLTYENHTFLLKKHILQGKITL